MRRRLLFSAELQADLPDHWTVQGLHIERSYPFVTSSEGVAFALAVAQDAERRDHHPELTLRYRDVTVPYWTHDQGGVTPLDLQAAARAEALHQGQV